MAVTYVVFLLDRTGSMARLKPTHLEGFNSYLSALQQRSDAADIRFTMVQFHGRGADTIYQRAPIHEVEPLSQKEFLPKGRTPLVDAACKTIMAVATLLDSLPAGQALDTMPSPAEAINVVCCIQSDGADNASVEYSWADLRTLVSEKQALGWQMIFLGADIAPDEQAEWMGLTPDSMMPYSPDLEATREIFARAAEKTANAAPVSHAGSAPGTGEGQQTETGSGLSKGTRRSPAKIPDDIAV
ncbi:hypothetical protein [Dichotomicrobium thermohalophilum]|uniref:von Willebrand factor type A domain-containing protein n=1 Tax=Dichotomicrobium thermohalophilum TaxID=933063 RepID=A0A397PJ72_9HYPH|nr:hypothetical protein [Dichotomicrobium thermohalophilum]RIA47217.1 hypothetical protein BXY53_2599 [Dichotomicrobium thermohalophilum]